MIRFILDLFPPFFKKYQKVKNETWRATILAKNESYRVRNWALHASKSER